MPQKYSPVAMALHWALVILVLYQIFLHPELHEIPRDAIPDAMSIHASVGLTILALVIIRIIWRLTHTAPALPDEMPEWQKRASKIVQWALDAVLIAMTLVGLTAIAMASYRAMGFGMIPLNFLSGADHDTHEAFVEVHEAINKVIIGLFLIHAGAALYHSFVKKDGVLRTMLPWG